MADASTYALIQRVTVASPTATITFSNIPQNFTDLKMVMSLRNNGTGGGIENTITLSLNGSTSNFTNQILYGDGTSAGSYSNSSYGGWTAESPATANTFANNEIYFPNYTSANYKSYSFDGVVENNAAAGKLSLMAGLWSNTAAITSISITPRSTFNWVQFCTVSLYGVGAVGTTPGTPKALGGDIVTSDGTYWYHAFLNSGQFTPSASLTCDYLVVAGGGSGGYTGGGGGAGGFRAVASQSLSAQSYPVLIGAGGGVGGYNPRIDGSNGTDSIFNTFTSTGGGRAATGNYVASTGGSGGGGSASGWGGGYRTGAAGNTPSTSPVQGFAGGTGATGGDFAGGGGGGASAVGGNSSGGTGGTGGAGANSYNSITITSWLSATGTGVSGYLGGGGGAGGTTAGAAGSGGGGVGAAGDDNGVSGTTNSGGGGGGSRVTTGNPNTGGSGGGGSGLIIIRYTI